MRKFYGAVLIFTAIAASVVTATSLSTGFADLLTNKNILSNRSKKSEYSLVLSSSNCEFIPTSRSSGQSTASNSPLTVNGNSIIFSYENARKENGYAMNLKASTGSIANASALTGLFSISVSYSGGSCQLSYGSSYNSYTNTINIESGVRYELSYSSYFKITSLGVDNSLISSITARYTCTGDEPLDPVTPHVHSGYHYLAKEPTADKPGNREFYACDECQYVSLTKEDSGTYVDAVLGYDLDSNHIAYLAPLYNLHNEYLRNLPQYPYPIAVNLELPNSTYNFDNTGTTDCTSVLQQALDDLSLAGGGTIYLPTGKYRLDSQLSIPNRITLVGDFYGPDAEDYGTVFLCFKAHDSSVRIHEDAQIYLRSNAGINGITFYYPQQNISNVVEYGYTIAVRSNAAANMANLFFINSYNGIAINNPTSGGGELANIENVSGTCLKNGILAYAQTDVGFWSNINLSPSYYANALSQYRCSDSTALTKYTRLNLTGLTLGDLDDFGLNKINIDNANIGIYFPSECVRSTQAFWGFLNNVNLTNCLTGVLCRGTYSQGAASFTHSSLGYVVNTAKEGMLKLSKTSYDAIVGDGKTLIEKGSETYEEAPVVDESNTYNIPNYLYYIDNLDPTGATDVSNALQTEINKIYTGGLIVLPNGTYRLDNPITIPNNTMLTSFGNSFSRSAVSEGSNELVKFISYSSDACVKLNNYSGINGIRIYNAYKDPDTAYNLLTNNQSDSFIAVKGLGNNCFAINTEASYTFTCFDFSNVSGHYIKYCYGNAYQSFIKAGASGKIIASLSNLSFISRTNLPSCAVANLTALEKYHAFDSTSQEDQQKFEFVKSLNMEYTTMIVVSSSSNEIILNCFSYGYKCLVNTSNSTVLAINTSIDYVKDSNYAYVVYGGDVTIVNTFRVFGKSFSRGSGHLKMYGRFDFTLKREAFFDSNVETSDPYEVMPSSDLTTLNLSQCESITNVSGATRSSTKHGGSYSWRASSQNRPAISYTFNEIDLHTFFSKSFLRLYIYCSNITFKGDHCTLELTSSGQCDDEEITFDINSQIKSTGWNEVIVELSSGTKGSSTEFDRKQCNFFRFYALNASCYYYVDDIDFLYESDGTEKIILNECEDTTNLHEASLSDFSMQGEHSFRSNSSQNTAFYFTFNAIDISSYMDSGYLCFYFYCEDTTKVGSRVDVELTSSGTWDVEERYLKVTDQVARDGWNLVTIRLSSMKSGSPGTTFDPTRLNFFRLYTTNSSCHFYLDYIYFVK